MFLLRITNRQTRVTKKLSPSSSTRVAIKSYDVRHRKTILGVCLFSILIYNSFLFSFLLKLTLFYQMCRVFLAWPFDSTAVTDKRKSSTIWTHFNARNCSHHYCMVWERGVPADIWYIWWFYPNVPYLTFAYRTYTNVSYSRKFELWHREKDLPWALANLTQY